MESKTIIEDLKKNPAIDFQKITSIISELETFKNNVNNVNEIDGLTNVIEIYKKMIKAAPMLKSSLMPNLELLNKTLQNLKTK